MSMGAYHLVENLRQARKLVDETSTEDIISYTDFILNKIGEFEEQHDLEQLFVEYQNFIGYAFRQGKLTEEKYKKYFDKMSEMQSFISVGISPYADVIRYINRYLLESDRETDSHDSYIMQAPPLTLARVYNLLKGFLLDFHKPFMETEIKSRIGALEITKRQLGDPTADKKLQEYLQLAITIGLTTEEDVSKFAYLCTHQPEGYNVEYTEEQTNKIRKAFAEGDYDTIMHINEGTFTKDNNEKTEVFRNET